MAVFNCSTYEADEINDTGTENETVDFKVQTQTNNLYTGGFSVTDTLKIKGINGVNVVASDDTIVIGVNGTGSTGGGTSGGDTGNSGVDTTVLELSVEALGERVEDHDTDLQDLSDRVSVLEQGGDDTTELEKTVDQHTTQIGNLNDTIRAQGISLSVLRSEVQQNKRNIEELQSNTGYGTGSGLPEATEADNGKVLGVVNGKIAWVEPTGGSGCNCPAIYTANSVGELPDPATVPEGSIGLVPSQN